MGTHSGELNGAMPTPARRGMVLTPRDSAAWTRGGPEPLERDLSFITDQLSLLPERKADF